MGLYDKALAALGNWKEGDEPPTIDEETNRQIQNLMDEQQEELEELERQQLHAENFISVAVVTE